MFKRLTVKNFRSIGDVALDLAPYTVIVGQNQAGKSNILRAMRAVFTNATGDDFIRQGQTSCSVELETEEGVTILWEKTKTSATYTIKQEGEDDRLFSKLAGQVPPEVQAALGIRSVEVDATTAIWPQVHQQGEFSFLVKPHLTAGQAARAIARLTKLDVVVKAQQLCKTAIRELGSTAKEERNAYARSSREMDEFLCLEQDKSYLCDLQAGRRALGEDICRFVEGTNAMYEYEMAEVASGFPIPTDAEMDELQIEIEKLDAVHELMNILDSILDADLPDITALRDELLRLSYGEAHAAAVERAQYEIRRELEAHVINEQEEEHVARMLDKYKGETCPVCGGTL